MSSRFMAVAKFLNGLTTPIRAVTKYTMHPSHIELSTDRGFATVERGNLAAVVYEQMPEPACYGPQAIITADGERIPVTD